MLRTDQIEALNSIDVLCIPVGGVGPQSRSGGSRRGACHPARVIIPMHYRAAATGWLEPVDSFLKAVGESVLLPGSEFALADAAGTAAARAPTVVVPVPPLRSARNEVA